MPEMKDIYRFRPTSATEFVRSTFLPATRRRILVFSGHSGAGTTSALVRLAVGLTIESYATARIINTDQFTIGKRLETLSRILDVPMADCRTCADLHAAIQEAGEDFLLVDTLNLSAKQNPSFHLRETLQYFKNAFDISQILVISASSAFQHTQKVIGHMDLSAPTSVVITKLDEFGKIKPLLRYLEEIDLPVLFATNTSSLGLPILQPGDTVIRAVEAKNLVKES